MKEVLYTIPVNDIFDTPCECPICSMRKKLEEEEVAFAMGPSYMEDDIRLTTDEIGFCSHHMEKLYEFENRLGLALIQNTHLLNIIKKIEKLQKKGRTGSSSLFSKQKGSAIAEYTKKLETSCFICNRIEPTFERYIATTFYLYDKDSDFRTKFKNSLGFCVTHYGVLYEKAPNYLSGNTLEDFTSDLNQVFLSNLKRMQEEVSWFIDKFDYRNAEAPWKTSKDALPRAMTKLNGV